MADVSIQVVIGQMLAVLQEAFEGPPNPWSYFIDKGNDAGLYRTLARLSAEQASRPVGGSSIAAHAHHVNFGLLATAAWVQGDRTPRNWPESWNVSKVDDVAWIQEQEQLRAGYDELRRAIEKHAADSLEAMGGALAGLAHVAYHLGAIRQKVACIGSKTVEAAG